MRRTNLSLKSRLLKTFTICRFTLQVVWFVAMVSCGLEIKLKTQLRTFTKADVSLHNIPYHDIKR